MKARVSITRTNSNVDKDSIRIAIVDDASSSHVVSVEMSPEDFALCVTGLASSPAVFNRLPTQDCVGRIGKTKETERVACDKVYDKEEQREIVLKDFSQKHSGWLLWDDGTRSQQNGKDHIYVICRYVGGE